MDINIKDLVADLEARQRPHEVRISSPTSLDDHELMFVSRHKDQLLTDVTEQALQLGDRPLRAIGTAQLNSITSFIDWVNRQKCEHTAIFGAGELPTPSVTAVINYSATLEDPQWGDYRGTYKLATSREWQAWMKLDGKFLGQEEFGNFIEDNLGDITAPSAVEDAAEYQLIKRLGGGAGDAASLLTAVRNLVVNESATLKSIINVHSGEAQMTFEARHTGEGGGQVTIPRLFVICIPVFDGDAAYRIPVRLRYRKAEGGTKVLLGTSLYQPERYVRDAWTLLLKQAAEQTNVPVFEGVPEQGGQSGYRARAANG